MKRTIAIAGTIAALSFAAMPLAAAAAAPHNGPLVPSKLDRSNDRSKVVHVDRTHDMSGHELSHDVS